MFHNLCDYPFERKLFSINRVQSKYVADISLYDARANQRPCFLPRLQIGVDYHDGKWQDNSNHGADVWNVVQQER